jgi:MarR family
MDSAPETQSTWLSVTDLAARLGRDKAAISRRASRLIEQGLLVWRRGPKGSKLINVEAFERLAAADVDAINEMNGLAAAAAGSPVLSREQARRTKIAADTAQLQLDALKGELVRLCDFSAGVTMQGEMLARMIDQLPNEASALAVEEAKNGSVFAQALLDLMRREPPGARSFFKTLAGNHRGAIADAFAALAQAPAQDTTATPLESETVA